MSWTSSECFTPSCRGRRCSHRARWNRNRCPRGPCGGSSAGGGSPDEARGVAGLRGDGAGARGPLHGRGVRALSGGHLARADRMRRVRSVCARPGAPRRVDVSAIARIPRRARGVLLDVRGVHSGTGATTPGARVRARVEAVELVGTWDTGEGRVTVLRVRDVPAVMADLLGKGARGVRWAMPGGPRRPEPPGTPARMKRAA